jgi:hypothetical protein
MAVRLHNPGYEHATKLINDGHVVLDDRDDWSEHQRSAREENDFIAEHGWNAYGRWHLGVDDESRKETKEHWKFPYGDFKDVHRCAILSAESRAAQRKYDDIETAVAHLHGMLEALKSSSHTST